MTTSVTPVWAQHDLEYQVKAEYLYNFVQFVNWPDSAWPSADAPFRICVAGADPFGPILDRAVQGERVGGHPLRVERPAADANMDRCQVVFLSANETPRSPGILKAITSTSVLTIGESTDFLLAGGAIAFALDGGRVRFDVNLQSPHLKDLRVSSKLLRLARTIWRQENGS